MNTLEIDNEIDIMLDEEANRIIKILLNMYENNQKVSKIFNSLVYDLMKDEFKLYEFNVIYKVVKLVPNDLTISLDKGKIFITNDEYENQKDRIKFRNTISNLKKEIANTISSDIVKNYKSYTNKSLLEIIYKNIAKKDLINLESKDITNISKQIVNNLKNDYMVKSINPLTLLEKEKKL